MPIGKGASATVKALRSDQDFVSESKERPVETEQINTETLDPQAPQTPIKVENPSLRELVREGKYEQICVFIPREMRQKLKMLEVQSEKGIHMSHFVKEALDDWFSARSE